MDQKMNVYSKIQHLLDEEPSDWLAESKRMEIEEHTPWLKTSQTVALRILGRLREINMSQNELADKIGISRQQVNKWLKGRENFTIETLTKLGEPVGMTLEELVQPFPEKNVIHKQEEEAELQRQR
jgi:plasmid maintenance system antidote protein VapI